jgi:hypothetical protein
MMALRIGKWGSSAKGVRDGGEIRLCGGIRVGNADRSFLGSKKGMIILYWIVVDRKDPRNCDTKETWQVVTRMAPQ